MDRDKWLDMVLRDKRLTDTEVAHLIKRYKNMPKYGEVRTREDSPRKDQVESQPQS